MQIKVCERSQSSRVGWGHNNGDFYIFLVFLKTVIVVIFTNVTGSIVTGVPNFRNSFRANPTRQHQENNVL